MSGNHSSHELLYLAGGLALGLGAGFILANRDLRESVKTSLTNVEPGHKGLGFPLGMLTLGGTLAAGAASLAPDIARYIKISSM
jgi:hypothetical protein